MLSSIRFHIHPPLDGDWKRSKNEPLRRRWLRDYHDDDDDDVYYAIKWIRNLITAPQIAHRNSRRKILISYTIPLFSYFFSRAVVVVVLFRSQYILYIISISLLGARRSFSYFVFHLSVCTHISDATHIFFFPSDFRAHSTFHLMSFLSASSLPRITTFIFMVKKRYTFFRHHRRQRLRLETLHYVP